jgi:hypothetical protein
MITRTTRKNLHSSQRKTPDKGLRNREEEIHGREKLVTVTCMIVP